jgi:hypothetical protein
LLKPVKMTDKSKAPTSSFMYYRNNYGHKMFYDTGLRCQRWLDSNHRYLREVDCSRYISLENIAKKLRMLNYLQD